MCYLTVSHYREISHVLLSTLRWNNSYRWLSAYTRLTWQPATRLTDTNWFVWQSSLNFLNSLTFNMSQLRKSFSGKFTCGTTCISRLPIFEQSNEDKNQPINFNESFFLLPFVQQHRLSLGKSYRVMGQLNNFLTIWNIFIP